MVLISFLPWQLYSIVQHLSNYEIGSRSNPSSKTICTSLLSVDGLVEDDGDLRGLCRELAVGEEGAEKVPPSVGEGPLQGERHLLVRHVEVHLK